LDLIENHFQQLLKEIDGPLAGGHSTVVDLKEPLAGFALDITTEFLLGSYIWSSTKDPSVSNTWGPIFANTLNDAFRWIAKRERLKVFYWLIDGVGFRRSCKEARTMVDKLITLSREAIHNGKDEGQQFAFAELLQENTDPVFVKDQFLNLLLAGRDTSAALLCWIFYILGREQGVLRQLKEELTTYLGTDKNRLPTRAVLNQMTALDNFICESKSLISQFAT
jgi:hypothetical protein